MRVRAVWSGLVTTALCFLLSIAPAAADLLIIVDKSSQRMSVWVDGAQRYVWKVSTGRPGYDTPSGSFRPFRLERDYFSKEWDDAPMPHAVFFTRIGHAIHGSYDTRHLGSPVSHGCIRIAPDNAALLFSLVESEGLGRTKVVVAGGSPVVAGSPFGAPSRPRLFAPAPLWPNQPRPPRWYGNAGVARWADQPPYYGNSNSDGGW